MSSLQPEAPTRVALYARVSSEDQAERGTIENQLYFLRQYAEVQKLHTPLKVVGEYVDDGFRARSRSPSARKGAACWMTPRLAPST